MAYDPAVLAALRKYAPKSGAPVAYVASAIVESGLNPRAVGDGGHSKGLFQENDWGRGHGLSDSERFNPEANARRAAEEFSRSAGKGPERAYNAQRPADRSGYIQKVTAAMDEARRILKAGGSPAQAKAAMAKVAVGADEEKPAGLDLGALAMQAMSNPDRTRSFTARMGDAYLASQLTPSTPTGDTATPVEKGRAPAAKRGAPAAPGGPVGNTHGSPIAGQPARGATHQTSGLAGYPAYDYMAPAGTRVGAPVSGVVTRLSGRDPSAGGPSGGALGYSVYITGADGKRYFLTHIDKLSVRVGQRIKRGQQIAVVANGPASWSSPHVHMGVNG